MSRARTRRADGARVRAEADRIVYVVDAGQSLHFELLFKGAIVRARAAACARVIGGDERGGGRACARRKRGGRTPRLPAWST